MAARIQASIHFDAADVTHDFKSGPNGFATLDLGARKDDVQLYLHFRQGGPELIHAVIAHLVALENEMTGAAAPDDAWRLTAKGVEAAEAQAARVGVPERMPTPVGHYCDSGNCEAFGATLYCERPAGHQGSHRAPGPDEGSEVAWSDCDATMPLPGFDGVRCSLERGCAEWDALTAEWKRVITERRSA
jgi:hypothetical protein